MGLIQNSDFALGLVYFLSIVNALQGVFLFIHFYITYQVILGFSRGTFLNDLITDKLEKAEEDKD